MRNSKLLALPLFLLILLASLSSAMEVEYDKAGSEIPLSKWWIERSYTPENRLGGMVPVDNIGLELRYEDYWSAPTEWATSSDVLFTVSPPSPALYWTVSTADFYDGRGWAKTTASQEVASFPSLAPAVEQVFTVTFTTSSPRVSLPVPQHRTNITNLQTSPLIGLSLHIDEVAGVYSITAEGLRTSMDVSYQATYASESIDLTRASLENIPPEISALYLRLPANLPDEVREIARGLKNPALAVGDQILADIAYLKNNFYYTGTRLSDTYGADASNSFADARTVGTKTVSGYLDNVDQQDFWKMYLAAGDYVAISISVPPGADFDLGLHGPDRSLLASSRRGIGESEYIYFYARSSGFHYLKIWRYYGSGYYSLSTSASYVEKDWIVDFWRRGEGTCMDFNTALAIILRLQGIPSRVNFGFQPGPVRDGERLYLASGAHSEAEAYLHPHGWVRVDATPEAGALRPQEITTPENPPATREPTEPLPLTIVQTITPTVLELAVSPENSTRKGAVSFSVRLTTGGGAAVAGKTITVTDGLTRKTLATITTGSDGRGSATYNFSKADAVGERFITARFAGDESYGASSDSEPFLLYAPTTLGLKLSETKIQRGSALTFSGELTDDFDEGVPAQAIAALLDAVRVGEVQTSGVGRYENSLVIGKNVAPGTHTLQTSFEPVGRGYLPSKSPAHNFEVLQEQAGAEVPENTGVGTPPENIAGPLGPAADMTLVYAAAIAGVTAAALAVAIRLFRPKKVKEEKPRIPTASAIKKMLAEFEKAKKYREGVIAAYHQLVGFLVGAGIYAVKPEQTVRELKAGLSGKIKAFAGEDFGEFVKVYEKAMFSDKPITKADFDHAAEKLCSALDSIKGGGRGAGT